jgi:transcriptional regulator with XRE-family HTH domain
VPVRSQQLLALGRALRSMREQRGLSQEGFALEAGVHRTYVGGIERGERNPSFASLLRLATVLDVPLSAIVSAAEERPEWTI